MDEVCNNRLNVEACIAPKAGVIPLHYMVTKVVCDDMPFVGEELLPILQTLSIVRKEELVRIVHEKITSFLKAYGFDIDIDVVTTMASRKASATRRDYDKLINLFVDMGSTNCKWIVTRSDENGKSGGFIDIPLGKSTKELCGEWGIDYDKSSAYRLPKEDFVVWLGYAVLGFMLRIQEEHKANIVNLKWSFPRIVGGVEVESDIEFDKVSDDLSEMLRPYGLRGRCEWVPEGIALACMFEDRLVELAKASDAEEKENERREAQEAKNREHNRMEREKEYESDEARRKEAEAWKKEHCFKRWFCAPVVTTRHYTANIQEESLGREEALKAFRMTGANADGKFNLLILDAGGSTLDYYYKPVSGNISTGSFAAGGKEVTDRLAEQLSVSPEVAEDRKRMLSKMTATSKTLLSVTEMVYGRSLSEIAKAVGNAKPLCVVASGLGMCNSQLRILLAKRLSLPSGQIIIYSPDVARLFPKDKYGEFPMFKAFSDIVGRVVEGGRPSSLPWPGGDVCGGMYFKRRG